MFALSISSLVHNHSQGQGGIHIPGGPFRLPPMGIQVGIPPFFHSPLEVFLPGYLLDQFDAFVISLFLNAAGLVFDRQPGPFMAGAVYGLSLAGIMFSRLLLMPLWQIVRDLEKEELEGSDTA